MAVGPHPNLYGNLTSGAPCASCGGASPEDASAKYQDYAGQFAPVGSPQPPCPTPDCSGNSSRYSPNAGG